MASICNEKNGFNATNNKRTIIDFHSLIHKLKEKQLILINNEIKQTID